MDIRKININQLNAAAYNPRKNLQPTDPEYIKLARSINEFGYVDPIIWNEQTGNVVGGHQRLKILIEQGYDEIDVSVVSLSGEKEKMLNISLNKISGEWDNELLSELLEEMSTMDIDLSITGFDTAEIDSILSSESFIDDLANEEFISFTANPTEFAVTFNFPTEHKQATTQYISNNGKEGLVAMIISKIMG